ncbi:MAG: 8-amino-7-oxononanoate synthase [Deltaproteobacteria bacterium]|nr:8-amino-7-oxononanoate synthase [Deltaproteobacteria bacterium]
MYDRIKSILSEIKESGNYRVLRYIKPVSATKILYNGKEYLNLCSNSYLSLHVHPVVLQAAKDALLEYGAGSCSSRSLSGSVDILRIFERDFADFKGYKKCLVFSCGYMANMGIIPTITTEKDTIFTDELNHSSLIYAVRLSKAKKVIYRHRDVNHLEDLIKKELKRDGKGFIVTESIFSMDGDIAPLKEILALKERYGLYTIVDDAHGTGVFGEDGSGVEEALGIKGSADIHMATLGKALGSFGGAVFSDPYTIRLLINRAKTFMYTTALPPSIVAAAHKALNLIRGDKELVRQLWENVNYVRDRLTSLGFNLKESVGPIIPIIVGDDRTTVKLQRMLMSKGLFIQAIRPPTVPPNTSRLRFTVVRAFTKTELDYIIDTLYKSARFFGIV